MAQLSNAYDSVDVAGDREDLADWIAMITPEETPLLSMLPSLTAKSNKVEWQTDTLATPVINNALEEGTTYSYAATTATTRVANQTQISMKQFLIAETTEALSLAGRGSERAMQKAKNGAVLKTDIEASMLSNNASVATTGAAAGQSGGLRAWLASNDSLGATGTSGGFSAGIVAAAGNGTQRTFTKALMDDALETAYNSGGNPTVAMFSPFIKRKFSEFMSDANVAQLRKEAKSSAVTLIGAADAYLSDWGLVNVVPNRQMARVGVTLTRNAYFIDPDKIAIAWLRKIQEDKDAAKTGDGLPCVIKCEWTLVVKNEAAHAVVADVFGTTASS